MSQDREDELLRSVALQNAQAIRIARQRADEELTRTRDELAQSLARMRATLEATTDGILAVDVDGTITDCNAHLFDLWRISRDAAKPGYAEIVRAMSEQFGDPAAFLARVDEIDKSSLPETYDLLETLDGRHIERFSRTQKVVERDSGRVWTFRDITERRRVEQTLREETRILELLNETGTKISGELDLRTLLQAVTDAGTQLSGAKFGAFFYNIIDERGEAFSLFTLAGAPREAFDKLGAPRNTPIFARTFKGEGIVRCDDVTLEPLYGQMAPHHGMPKGHLPVRSYLAVPVVSRSGAVIGGLFFGHPEPARFSQRTERLLIGIASQAAVAVDNARLYEDVKRLADERENLLDAERAAREDLQRASFLKDDFLASVSHELRTPLNAILGWAQVIATGKVDDEDSKRGLETIVRNARAQAQLIEDLMDMSRIASGKVRLDVQETDIPMVVQQAVETIRPSADSKAIRIRQIVDPSIGPVSGDPNRLQQIVWNLLSNAVKFTPKAGNVDVIVQRVNSHIELTVRDSGVGIGRDFLPHVFERFRQADSAPTRAYGGLGLGLSIVKHLVELHGGTIRAYSDGENRGSTFVVALPLAPVRTNEKRGHPTTSKGVTTKLENVDLERVRVLVVEDESDARELIKRVLEQYHAEVRTAGSANEALEALVGSRPDVIISDIGMPGVDGYEFMRQVRRRASEHGGRVPAIALTAFARSEDRTRALMAGYQMHIAKPIEPHELVASVASFVGWAHPDAAH
jgi:signal transduction histidine kinase/ActR/RegA family two-component response regulator